MSRLNKALMEELAHRLPRGRQALIEELVRLGLIDWRRCEELMLRDEVLRLIRSGERVVDALMMAAQRFCCSYEKARYIYYKRT